MTVVVVAVVVVVVVVMLVAAVVVFVESYHHSNKKLKNLTDVFHPHAQDGVCRERHKVEERIIDNDRYQS
ncbi:hypothetical protein E2C01_102877 [Portunus trituberculatus]|uniref:Uncharacterized protein n=1 Tax=Portunus trituberculatus TaxID=210409 RepID=A0A5B7KJJ7_PORTR|nr:hypothetical protein [Portunus trituberculatus]